MITNLVISIHFIFQSALSQHTNRIVQETQTANQIQAKCILIALTVQTSEKLALIYNAIKSRKWKQELL